MTDKMNEQNTDMSNVYKTFGRHTALGKHMYKTYNSQKARHDYKPNVKLQLKASDPHKNHQQTLYLKQQKLRIKQTRMKTVFYPQNRKKSHTKIPQILKNKGRKKQTIIKHQLQTEYERKQMPFRYHEPREKKIKELQNIMHIGMKEEPLKTQKVKNQSVCQPSIEQQLHEIWLEIQEREQFLEDMKILKAKDTFSSYIKIEIKEKYMRFEKLCQKLQRMKEKENEKKQNVKIQEFQKL